MGWLDGVGLVDQHCHGVWGGDLTREQVERGLSESLWPPPEGASAFDSQLGVAVRRWCAPVLDLEPHASPSAYVDRRLSLGAAEANRRLLSAAGLAALCVDTGYAGASLLEVEGLGRLAGASAGEIVRLETIAEALVQSGAGPRDFVDGYSATLDDATRSAVALKSVLAYRAGFDVPAERPRDRDVRQAAERWCRRCNEPGRVRLDEPVLLRWVLWCGVDVARARALPLQMHCGFGDPDLTLRLADPSLLTGFLRLLRPVGVPVVLLHNYPYHRQAAYLAHVFPHVYVDIGLAVNHVGARASAVLAEVLELAPFHKVMYSSDAFGLAELHYLGAVLFRRALDAVLGSFVDRDEWSRDDAARVARHMGAETARRLYPLPV